MAVDTGGGLMEDMTSTTFFNPDKVRSFGSERK
jgi:hypothetical protein